MTAGQCGTLGNSLVVRDEPWACAIAKKYSRATIFIVNDGAHGVTADDENFFVRAGCELGAHGECVGKSRARGRKIEAPGIFCTQLVLHEAGGGRKHHVRRNGGEDDQIDFGWVGFGLC